VPLDDAFVEHLADLAAPVGDVPLGAPHAQRRLTAQGDAMFPCTAMRTPLVNRAHLLGVPTPEPLVHEPIIVGRMVARIDSFEPVPVLAKERFEDVPVRRGG
jgi:hypothetical protein